MQPVLWPTLLAAIPSPPDNAVGIGPLELRAYGLAIAVGAVVGVMIAQRRWTARGGHPDDVTRVAKVAIPAGLVGARLYHVVTDWHRFDDAPMDVVKVWEGGLGIPGGILLGALGGVVAARRIGVGVPAMLDEVAPAIPVAQAIGRLGNWFNQELFGGPTDLPWGLEIDPAHRPAEFADVATFHPTFLYEGLWNLALAATLVRLGTRTRLRAGQLFVLYVGGYALGRLWVEALRVDPATTLAGVRVNIWVSGAVLLLAGIVFLRRRSRGPASGVTEELPDPVGV